MAAVAAGVGEEGEGAEGGAAPVTVAAAEESGSSSCRVTELRNASSAAALGHREEGFEVCRGGREEGFEVDGAGELHVGGETTTDDAAAAPLRRTPAARRRGEEAVAAAKRWRWNVIVGVGGRHAGSVSSLMRSTGRESLAQQWHRDALLFTK